MLTEDVAYNLKKHWEVFRATLPYPETLARSGHAFSFASKYPEHWSLVFPIPTPAILWEA